MNLAARSYTINGCAMIQEAASLSRTALVLYGTETGTSQDLAFEISHILERHCFETDVEELDSINVQDLTANTIVVFVVSTTGQGEFPSNARRFWRSLLPKRLTSTFLSGLEYTLVGLGDTSYPKFNLAARKLHKRLSQLGASCVLQPCEADEQGEDSTDGAFIAWARLFESKLSEAFPLPEGIKPKLTEEELTSKWTLSLAVNRHVTNGAAYDSPAPARNGHLLKHSDITFNAVLELNDRITPTDHWQDVRFLRLKTGELIDYLPGDALAIRPRNSDTHVQQFIDLMDWAHIADEPLRFQLNKRSRFSDRLPDPSISPDATVTLRQLLTQNLDINAIPRRSFFAAIARYTTDEMHRDRLLEFTDPQYLDEYYDYATRPRRSILEILQEFDSVKLPWQEVSDVIPILRPRQFSIASGGLLKEGGSTFELVVAIVKYRTVIRRIREGTCTKYLAKLPVGTQINITLKTEGRFDKPEMLSSKRHLLVGAGTGIAPLRAVIHEKYGSNSPTTLIFGCRSAHADYFFQDEWQRPVLSSDNSNGQSNPFQVITAFSRDQQQKVYVQDKIREHKNTVLEYLLDHNSVIIICGSSGPMPKAVRQAFVDVLNTAAEGQTRPLMSVGEADQFLVNMEKTGRYKQETW